MNSESREAPERGLPEIRTVTFEGEMEPIEVMTIGRHEPDPSWRYTDPAGHEHRFEGDQLPTLEWVVVGKWWCQDCRELHDDGEWVCRQCRAVVEPKFRWSLPERKLIPGPTTVRMIVNGEHVFELEEEERPLSHDLQGRDAIFSFAARIMAERKEAP